MTKIVTTKTGHKPDRGKAARDAFLKDAQTSKRSGPAGKLIDEMLEDRKRGLGY